MRLLDRYLLRELLVPLGYCLCGFLIFYTAFDLIFQINRFQENHLRALDVVGYYVVTLPELLVGQVIPVSLLLASLYALTNHSRHNELTAMRAAGVSLWRLSLPYLGVGCALGVVVFLMNELWVPTAMERSKLILQSRQPNAANLIWTPKLNFHNEAAGRDWSAQFFNRATGEMKQPNVNWKLPDGSARHYFANRGIFTNGQWLFYNVEEWDTEPHAEFPINQSNAVVQLPFNESPEWINSEIKVNDMNLADAAKRPQVSIREIMNYKRLQPMLGEKKAQLLTQLQARIAEPFTCLAVVLIALPFGARSGRRNVFVGVAGSIFICFGYFILQRISLGLGIGGYLAPVVAAWLPNLLCAATGVIAMARLR